jgi:hypothetical protein
MIKWLRNKFKKPPRECRSIYENSLGFTIWKNNDGDSSCSEGHIFRQEKDSDKDMELELISYVFKTCREDGQTIKETLIQIERNLNINNLCEEENVL